MRATSTIKKANPRIHSAGLKTNTNNYLLIAVNEQPMRTIKNIHDAEYSPIADLITHSPLPSKSVDQIDPFLFLNHHGPQIYKPDNNGLPFGPHPHRGMEIVTFILEGDVIHKDSEGHKSMISAGGIQWLTTGSGLIHAEVSSDEFKKKGGALETVQLWINLPERFKMVPPRYHGFQKENIPFVIADNGKAQINVISGRWEDIHGAYEPLTPIRLMTVEMLGDARVSLDAPIEHNIFFYVVRGKLNVNGKDVHAKQLVEFNNDSEEIVISAHEDSYIIFGNAVPFREPVVAHGPFVMNSIEGIRLAYEDYMDGRFGSWYE